jgi:hypothetical protein
LLKAGALFFLGLIGLTLTIEVRAQGGFSSQAAAFLNYLDTTTPNVTETGSGPHRIGRTGFFFTDARFQTNDLVNGSNYMYAALGDADSEGNDAGFSMWPAMDCYLRWDARLPAIFTPLITNYFETQLTINGTNYSSGGTANQEMMFSTARYLAGSVWGTNAFPAGSQFQASYGTGDPTGKAFVSNTIANIPFYGLLEHDSLIYAGVTLGPVYTLEQFAPDPVLQHKAQMAFDWGVAEMSGYYFYDNWAIASDRTEPYWTQNIPTGTTIMTYLFFGGPVPSAYTECSGSAPYCLPNFQGILPEVVMAATNRSEAYTYYSTDMRNTAGYNNAYYKTSYITPAYSLYSQAECGVQTNSDGSFSITNYGTVSLSDPNEMQRWGIIWNAPNDQTKFWITNPYNPVYSGSYPNIYIGTTVSEEVVQLGGTLAAVYNIPTNATRPDWVHNGASMANYQELEGQIPTNYQAYIDNSGTSGRLFLYYTNVMISLYISTNFTWVPDTSETNYFLIPANIAGLAVETASPNDYTQSTPGLRLAAFKNDVMTLGGVNTNFLAGPNPEMVYTDRLGNTLEITFGIGAKTNGQNIDYQQGPTISNPWMYQAQLGNLFIFGTNRTIIYNYNTWTETTNSQPTLLTSAALTTKQNNYVNVDLTTRASDAQTPSSNLLFSVNNPSNGTIKLLPDGHTAQFMPATNYSGPGGFGFATTDYGIDPRLVFYYNFEPPDTIVSNYIADVSGNARNATIVTVGAGAPSYNVSVPTNFAPFIQQSLQLTQYNNGANAEELTRTITTGNLSMTNGSWTFATWFNRSMWTNDNFIFYMGSGDGFGGDGDELQLYCPNNTNTVALSHWNASNIQDISLVSPNTVGSNQWHHVAMVFQHVAAGTNNVNLYLDGSLVATTNITGWALKQNYPLVFGGHASTTAHVYRWFNGLLDDIALFRGALSSNEVTELVERTVNQFGGWTVTNTISVNVIPITNTVPVLASISNRTINPGVTLVITNMVTDTDQPEPMLVFSLPVGPTNATITTNILAWRPVMAQANTTNPFSVCVIEEGTPELSATQSFAVTVNPISPSTMASVTLTNKNLQFLVNGAFGPDYTIQASSNLLAGWTSLFFTNSPTLPFTWADTNIALLPQRFYRLQLGP